MSTVSNNLDIYQARKVLASEILARLSGDYFASAIFRSGVALDPRKGLSEQFGDKIYFEVEAATTARTLSKGGTLQYDDTPQVTTKTLAISNFTYVGLKHDEFDRAALKDAYIDNYAQARARDLAVKLEQDIIKNILKDTNIPASNTITLSNFSNKLTQDVLNEALTILRNNGHTSGSRVFAVIDTTREGQLRGSLSVYDKTGEIANRQFLASSIINIYGIETYGVLGSGSFNRIPTNTTSDGVSGTAPIVGFVISEEAYRIAALPLPETQPGVEITTVIDPNIPLGLRRVLGYDMDKMQNKDVLGVWWGDLVVKPELVVPITT